MLTSFINSDIIFTIILSISLIALALEVMIPSFGLIGIIGIYLFIESILAIQYVPNPIISIIIAIIVTIIVVFIISKTIIKNIETNRLVLQKNLSKITGNKNSNLEKKLIGKEAIVVKTMRPSGEIEIENEVYHAISDGNFITKGEKVIIEGIKGGQILCRKIEIK